MQRVNSFTNSQCCPSYGQGRNEARCFIEISGVLKIRNQLINKLHEIWSVDYRWTVVHQC